MAARPPLFPLNMSLPPSSMLCSNPFCRCGCVLNSPLADVHLLLSTISFTPYLHLFLLPLLHSFPLSLCSPFSPLSLLLSFLSSLLSPLSSPFSPLSSLLSPLFSLSNSHHRRQTSTTQPSYSTTQPSRSNPTNQCPSSPLRSPSLKASSLPSSSSTERLQQLLHSSYQAVLAQV